MKQMLLFVLTFGVLAPLTHGEEALAQIRNLLQEEGVKSRLHTILTREEAKYSPSCTVLEDIQPKRMVVLEEAPLRWVVRFDVTACKQAKTRSLLFHQTATGLEITPMLPGATLTDPALQTDVVHALFMAHVKRYPTCKTPFVRETTLNDPPRQEGEAWEEIWMADMCGERLGQIIRFVPTEDGTAFGLQVMNEEEKSVPLKTLIEQP